MICLRLTALIAVFGFAATTLAAETKPPTKSARPDGPVTETEIKAAGEATFDASNHVATFVGGVVVTDPRFTMRSQKLTVYLAKNRDPNAPDDSATSGIERAVAEGNVELVQNSVPGAKPTDPAEKVSGRSERATFEPKTGVMVLTGSPVVRRGVNEHIATSNATVMTLTRDGGLKTSGPSKTIIRDSNKADELTTGAPKNTASSPPNTTPKKKP